MRSIYDSVLFLLFLCLHKYSTFRKLSTCVKKTKTATAPHLLAVNTNTTRHALLSGTLPTNSAIVGYATEGVLCCANKGALCHSWLCHWWVVLPQLVMPLMGRSVIVGYVTDGALCHSWLCHWRGTLTQLVMSLMGHSAILFMPLMGRSAILFMPLMGRSVIIGYVTEGALWHIWLCHWRGALS